MGGDQKTIISCDQLGNFINEIWMDVLHAESVHEIELKLDMIDGDIGESLAPCIGREVLNEQTEDWDSISKILYALKTDARGRALELHREGADDPGGEKYTQTKIDMLIKRIEQMGKDPKRRVERPKKTRAVYAGMGEWEAATYEEYEEQDWSEWDLTMNRYLSDMDAYLESSEGEMLITTEDDIIFRTPEEIGWREKVENFILDKMSEKRPKEEFTSQYEMTSTTQHE